MSRVLTSPYKSDLSDVEMNVKVVEALQYEDRVSSLYKRFSESNRSREAE